MNKTTQRVQISKKVAQYLHIAQVLQFWESAIQWCYFTTKYPDHIQALWERKLPPRPDHHQS